MVKGAKQKITKFNKMLKVSNVPVLSRQEALELYELAFKLYNQTRKDIEEKSDLYNRINKLESELKRLKNDPLKNNINYNKDIFYDSLKKIADARPFMYGSKEEMINDLVNLASKEIYNRLNPIF